MAANNHEKIGRILTIEHTTKRTSLWMLELATEACFERGERR